MINLNAAISSTSILARISYQRMRVRTDPNASVSMFGNGFDNLAGRTARAAWSDRVRALNAEITETTDDISAHETAETSLAALTAKLAEMKTVADQTNDDTLTGDQLQTLQDQYEVLYGEFTDLLAGATHNGSELLSGTSPMKMLNVAALALVDFTSDVQGGVLAVSAAITEVNLVSVEVSRDLVGLQDSLASLDETVTGYAGYEATLDTMDAARAVLESVSLSMMAMISETMTESLVGIQSNVNSIRALALLAADNTVVV